MRNLILEECILNLFTKIILDLNCEKAVGNIIIIEEFWFRILQIIVFLKNTISLDDTKSNCLSE